MYDSRSDIAEFEDLAVLDGMEREIGTRASEEHVLGTGRLGQSTSGGHMVRMNMRIDHIEDAHAGRACRVEIGLDRKDRVDDGRRGLAAAAEQIGRGDGIEMK